MTVLIKREFVIDEQGKPQRLGVYLADQVEELPESAPVGSRAMLSNGKVMLKTPSGWRGREAGS